VDLEHTHLARHAAILAQAAKLAAMRVC
jgi:hypothetical protein